jgi:UDPglucose--hexose-1-phosphate uridylyltransferase
VSGEWSVVASGRKKRPHQFAKEKNLPTPKKDCPFEEYGSASRVEPLLALSRNGTDLTGTARAEKDWFVQVIPNKFPAFVPDEDVKDYKVGPYTVRSGYGYHEVIIVREHTRHWKDYTPREAATIFKAYQMRYRELAELKGVKYVAIFHNFGPDAGASIYHPHSQVMAIPVVPRDVRRSYRGSEEYFVDHGTSVHTKLLRWELQQRKRIVYENDTMVAFCPFSSKATFEVRIFPKRRKPDFGDATEKELADAADALAYVLRAMGKKLGNPSFNFFIHTAHCNDQTCQEHYHWHLEIYPKVSIWAGFEVGTGIEISTVSPEDAAKMLRGRSAKKTTPTRKTSKRKKR